MVRGWFGGVIWGRCGVVDWGGFWVVESWGVNRLGCMIRGLFGSMIWGRFSFISHIGNISILVISSISHNLDTTIGKSHFIFTMNYTVIILSLVFAEISSTVFIIYTIFIGKRPRREFICWFWVIGFRCGRMVRCGFRCMVRSGSGGMIRGWGVVWGWGMVWGMVGKR